jgi:hypothetical protein
MKGDQLKKLFLVLLIIALAAFFLVFSGCGDQVPPGGEGELQETEGGPGPAPSSGDGDSEGPGWPLE